MGNYELKVAVVVGHHTYEVQKLQEMFESFPGIHCYIQHLEQFTSSSKDVRRSYDVIIFYTMWLETPTNEGPWYEGKALDALSDLGDTRQGLFILHHSIMAFEKWSVWELLTGFAVKKYRGYQLDVPMNYHVENRTHPIMDGVSDFCMIDEAYETDGEAVMNTQGNVEVLLTTDCRINMRTVAWTKAYKNSRVFCYQSGHDCNSYQNENFKRIVYNGIRWAAQLI